MSLFFEAVGHGALRRCDAEFTTGKHVILSADARISDVFVGLAGGALRAERGRVLLRGLPPATSPLARRSLGTLRRAEALPPAKDVRSALGLGLAARHSKLEPDAVLAQFGIGDWAARSVRLLNNAEIRALILALILGDEAAKVLVLEDPLASALPAELVVKSLMRSNAELVVSCTGNLADARALGDRFWFFEHGILVPHDARAKGTMLTQPSLRVRTKNARALAAKLAERPEVLGIEGDLNHATHELVVSTADIAALGRLVVEIAAELGIEIETIALGLPQLESIFAARQALGAYQSAYAGHQPSYGSIASGPAGPAPVPWGSVTYPGANTLHTPNQSTKLEGPEDR